MKITNFSELDKVLKNSFSAIRKELSDFKKQSNTKTADTTKKLSSKTTELDKKLKQLSTNISSDLEKQYKKIINQKDTSKDTFQKSMEKSFSEVKDQISKDQTLSDTKIQTLAKEVRNFKKDVKTIQDNQRQLLQQVQSELQKATDQNAKFTAKEVKKLENSVEEVKKNIVKLMEVLREKLVSKETFEQRNTAYENFLKDVLDQTKDLDKVKLSYFARNSMNDQLGAFESRLKEFHGEQEQLSSQVSELRSEHGNLVQSSVHEESASQLANLKDQHGTLASQVANLQLESSSKNDLSKLQESVNTLKSSLELTESSWKARTDNLNQDLKEIRAWRREIESLQKQLLKQDQLSQQNKAKIDLIQDMNLTTVARSQQSQQFQIMQPEPVVVEEASSTDEFFTTEKIDVVKDVETMLQAKSSTESYTPPKIEEQKSGFSKFKEGFVNFFFEEVEEPTVEVRTEPVRAEPTPPVEKKKELNTKPVVKTEAKKAEPKKTKETPKEEKKAESTKQYMHSRDPKIFEDIDSVEPGSRKKRYKRVEGDEITTEPSDEVYYPEDYFY